VTQEESDFVLGQADALAMGTKVVGEFMTRHERGTCRSTSPV
jgi:hypothetical protein